MGHTVSLMDTFKLLARGFVVLSGMALVYMLAKAWFENRLRF